MSSRIRRSVLATCGSAVLLCAGCVDHKGSKAGSSASAPVLRAPPTAGSSGGSPAAVPAVVWGSAKGVFANGDARCAELRAAMEKRWLAVRDPFEASSPEDSKARVSAFRRRVAEHSACVPVAGGAWAVAFDGGADPREWAWSVVHFDERGARSDHAGNFPDEIDKHTNPARYTGKANFFDDATYHGPIGMQVVSDYDEDHEPEAVVWTAELGDEVRSTARGMLWSFSKGAVLPYRKADKLGVAPFDRDFALGDEAAPLKDVDGDGRIDLLGYGPFNGVFPKTCGVLESLEALGPRLVVHSLLDGTFAAADPVVVADAKRQCPSAPSRIFIIDPTGHVDDSATFVQLACARLWGVPTATLDEEKDRVCGNAPAQFSGCDSPRVCSAELLLVFADWSRKKPPFRLK
jgi:hypothetical protein